MRLGAVEVMRPSWMGASKAAFACPQYCPTPSSARWWGAMRLAVSCSAQGGGVLVTGAAGFIGSHVVERLLWMGERVVAIDSMSEGSGPYPAAWKEHNTRFLQALSDEGDTPGTVKFIRADIRDRQAVEAAFQDPAARDLTGVPPRRRVRGGGYPPAAGGGSGGECWRHSSPHGLCRPGRLPVLCSCQLRERLWGHSLSKGYAGGGGLAGTHITVRCKQNVGRADGAGLQQHARPAGHCAESIHYLRPSGSPRHGGAAVHGADALRAVDSTVWQR
mmetsp:Transcript_20880/g.57905  ORF Transcript_20880/g.57905 Transcript_20880/m.57905 type:complete len:275 (+) Transcript_20880:99-923(+)